MSWEFDNDRIRPMMMPDVAELAARELMHALAVSGDSHRQCEAIGAAFRNFEKYLQDENKRLQELVLEYRLTTPRYYVNYPVDWQCAGSPAKPPALVQPNGTPETVSEAFRDELGKALRGEGDPINTNLAQHMSEEEYRKWVSEWSKETNDRDK